jgi:purine nucleoside permease
MEDSGTLQSLSFLASAGRVDMRRVLVLRTASDFDQPSPGQTAAEALANSGLEKYSGYLPSLEAAWHVGHVVVAEILKNWGLYRDTVPGKPVK